MKRIDLKLNSKKYKIVYNRENHKKDVANYLTIPYKDHYIIEMWGVKANLITKGSVISPKINKLISELKLHPLTKFTHQFTPHGVTGFVILQESHLSIHTWPELLYVHMEVLTCSKDVRFSVLDSLIESQFSPEYYEIAELIY